jgi:hypothetical protein
MTAVAAALDTPEGPAKASAIVTWRPDRPALITFDIATHANRQKWTFSRDLVAAALTNPGEHGEGDVVVKAEGLVLFLLLSGVDEPTGEWAKVQIRMPRGAVAWLVEQSNQLVAPGSEAEIAAITAEIDADLESLLADGGAE